MKCFLKKKERVFQPTSNINKMSSQNATSANYNGSNKGGRAAGRVANKVSKKVNNAKEQKRYEKIRATRISIDAIEYEYEEDTKKVLLSACANKPRKEEKRYNSKIMTNKRVHRNEQIGKNDDEDNEDTNIGHQLEFSYLE